MPYQDIFGDWKDTLDEPMFFYNSSLIMNLRMNLLGMKLELASGTRNRTETTSFYWDNISYVNAKSYWGGDTIKTNIGLFSGGMCWVIYEFIVVMSNLSRLDASSGAPVLRVDGIEHVIRKSKLDSGSDDQLCKCLDNDGHLSQWFLENARQKSFLDFIVEGFRSTPRKHNEYNEIPALKEKLTELLSLKEKGLISDEEYGILRSKALDL